MQNIQMNVTGNKLVITIDLNAPATASASGKSLVVASSQGNQPIPNTDLFLGVNVYRKARAKVDAQGMIKGLQTAKGKPSADGMDMNQLAQFAKMAKELGLV